jgi:hypothetical protein
MKPVRELSLGSEPLLPQCASGLGELAPNLEAAVSRTARLGGDVGPAGSFEVLGCLGRERPDRTRPVSSNDAAARAAASSAAGYDKRKS